MCCSPWGRRVGDKLASEQQTVNEHQKKRNKTRKLGKSDKDLNARAKL